jgi:hypothetical protein
MTGAGDEVIRDMAGHVSKEMLKHYSHIRTQAKRRAVDALVIKPEGRPQALGTPPEDPGTANKNSRAVPQDLLQVKPAS